MYEGINVLPLATVWQEPVPETASYAASVLLPAYPRTTKKTRYAMYDPTNTSLVQTGIRSCACAIATDNYQIVYSFKLDKAYVVDALLVIGDKDTRLAGGFEVYIGNDTDWTKNAKCPGGPFLRCDNPPCDMFDINTWQTGFEVWCNLPG